MQRFFDAVHSDISVCLELVRCAGHGERAAVRKFAVFWQYACND